MTVAPTPLPHIAERPLADRAAEGDRAALETMFAQFLPAGEPILDADYLGTFGLWLFGTRSFAAVTPTRAAALQVRRFGRITYQDAIFEHVHSGAAYQPSRLLFYAALAVAATPFVAAGLALLPVVGVGALALVLVGLLLLPLTARVYRAFVKSGLVLWVREGSPVYAFCDRTRLARANALYRVAGGQRDRLLPPVDFVDVGVAEDDDADGTLVRRARSGSRSALATMFGQFLPAEDPVVDAAALGTQGLWGIGTHSFACATPRRIASLRVSTFGQVVFQEASSTGVNGARIHQPSRIPLYLIVAGWALLPVYYGLPSAGPPGLLGLLVTIPTLPLVVRAYYGRVKSGATVSIREAPQLHIFCDRARLAALSSLYRRVSERASSAAAVDAQPIVPGPAPAPSARSSDIALIALAVAAVGLFAIGAVMAGRALTSDDEATPTPAVLTQVVTETQAAPETVASGAANGDVLALVPADIAQTCIAADADDAGAVATAACTHGTSLLSYTLFATTADMLAAYQSKIDGAVDVDSGAGNCESGSAGEGTWSLGGVDAGRVACFDYNGSTFFYWTYDQGPMLVTGFESHGNWSSLYDTWMVAGPTS